VSHDIDNLKLPDEVVNEQLNGLNSELIFKLLDVGCFVHDFHDVLSFFLIVDSVNAGLGEPLGELLQNMIASFHDFGSWERLHFQKGVACVLLMVPEFNLILFMITSYLLLS
jgi:hypothetical protein